jgi:hypothetical protein
MRIGDGRGSSQSGWDGLGNGWRTSERPRFRYGVRRAQEEVTCDARDQIPRSHHAHASIVFRWTTLFICAAGLPPRRDAPSFATTTRHRAPAAAHRALPPLPFTRRLYPPAGRQHVMESAVLRATSSCACSSSTTIASRWHRSLARTRPRRLHRQRAFAGTSCRIDVERPVQAAAVETKPPLLMRNPGTSSRTHPLSAPSRTGTSSVPLRHRMVAGTVVGGVRSPGACQTPGAEHIGARIIRLVAPYRLPPRDRPCRLGPKSIGVACGGPRFAGVMC